MTGPRRYDVIVLSAEFDIDLYITVAGRIPLRLRREGLTVSTEISIDPVLKRPSDFDSRRGYSPILDWDDRDAYGARGLGWWVLQEG